MSHVLCVLCYVLSVLCDVSCAISHLLCGKYSVFSIWYLGLTVYPRGGSVVILSPLWRIDMGNSGVGAEDSQRRKASCGPRVGSSATWRSRFGVWGLGSNNRPRLGRARLGFRGPGARGNENQIPNQEPSRGLIPLSCPMNNMSVKSFRL